MENRIATVALAFILGMATLSPAQAQEICLPDQQRRDRRASLIVLRARQQAESHIAAARAAVTIRA